MHGKEFEGRFVGGDRVVLHANALNRFLHFNRGSRHFALTGSDDSLEEVFFAAFDNWKRFACDVMDLRIEGFYSGSQLVKWLPAFEQAELLRMAEVRTDQDGTLAKIVRVVPKSVKEFQ